VCGEDCGVEERPDSERELRGMVVVSEAGREGKEACEATSEVDADGATVLAEVYLAGRHDRGRNLNAEASSCNAGYVKSLRGQVSPQHGNKAICGCSVK
jgi:hypothetical protein